MYCITWLYLQGLGYTTVANGVFFSADVIKQRNKNNLINCSSGLKIIPSGNAPFHKLQCRNSSKRWALLLHSFISRRKIYVSTDCAFMCKLAEPSIVGMIQLQGIRILYVLYYQCDMLYCNLLAEGPLYLKQFLLYWLFSFTSSHCFR